MPTRREVAEKSLVAALSRQVGYTTGAYDLTRFVEVAKMLVGRPFVLLPLLERRICDQYGVSKRYAKGVLDVVTAIGLVSRIGEGQRIPRFFLSNVGRSVVAAEAAGETEVLKLTMVAAILQGDADAYYAVLNASATGQGPRSLGRLRQVFAGGMKDLRAARRAWLRETIPTKALRERVTEFIPWWRHGVRDLNPHFVRHHCTPRLGWARSLGHICGEDHLTKKGEEMIARMRAGEEDYFWLGPPEVDLKVLRIPEHYWRQPLGGAWEVLRPTAEASGVPRGLLSGLLEYMQRTFEVTKLATANQAPTAAVLPFIYAYEMRTGERYDPESVLGALRRYDPSSFTTLRTRESLFGFYMLRR